MCADYQDGSEVNWLHNIRAVMNYSDIHVTYSLTGGLEQRDVAAAVELLSPAERARHDRLVFARDRRDFAVAHAMLRRALSMHDDRQPHEWTFVSTGHGKPMLPLDVAMSTRLAFNIAHTDGLVACAVVHDADIGIDVETIDRQTNALELARRYFSETECADLERCAESQRQTRFIEIWTLKEAYVKAIGEGLSRPLDGFTFMFDDRSSVHFESTGIGEEDNWRFALFAPSHRHRMSLAVRGDSPDARRITIRTDGSPAGAERATMVPLRSNLPPRPAAGKKFLHN